MALALGLPGGVMLQVSSVGLLPGGIETVGFVPANLAFFGIAVMFLIDIWSLSRWTRWYLSPAHLAKSTCPSWALT